MCRPYYSLLTLLPPKATTTKPISTLLFSDFKTLQNTEGFSVTVYGVGWDSVGFGYKDDVFLTNAMR